jgi:putative ABC transport system ATP-binding protein
MTFPHLTTAESIAAPPVRPTSSPIEPAAPASTTPAAAPPDRSDLPVPPAAQAVTATKVYEGGGQVVALDGVDLSLDRGRFTAIMGPSGSGKSTLMHCLAGLDTLTSGHILLGALDLGTLSDQQLTRVRRDRIGFVFQSFNLVPTLTAIENITLPSDLARRTLDEAWLDHIIDTVGLRDRLEHRPSELSGGQQQRVAVARALAGRPEMVFADEPTGNLDSRSGAEVLGFLRQAVSAMGQTVVMVTHDPVAAGYADRVVFLADGRLAGELADPTAERVLERMKHFGETEV